MWINIQVFDLIPLIKLSVSMSIPSCFPYHSSIIELDARDVDFSRRIAQDCFGYPGFSVFPFDVEYGYFEVCDELCCDFDGDFIESVDFFW